jgi:4-aminobutyrate aminotransferase/(S)-3-amino-2-methylpropionate transaminase
MAAAQAQMQRFTHTCFQVMLYEPYVALAEALNKLAPLEGPAKTFFLTTGAEATENAVKIARAATGRANIIAFTGGFHGRTIMAMSMTGKVAPYKKGLGPSQPFVWHVPFPVLHHGVTVEDTLRHLDFLFRADVDPSDVAAIIIEPVQGEGGFHPAPPELMRVLRGLCDRHGIILIADEVQTGFARTGKLFAMEHYDIKADLICVAKSLAGGFPLSGVIGREIYMDAPAAGGLGGTYAGNPIACAAALAVLDVIDKEGLIERANWIGTTVKSRLALLRSRNNVLPIANIRGPGAMVAFDVVGDTSSNAPDAAATKVLIDRAAEHGLVLLSCGTTGNTIRIMVPLTVEKEILEEGLDKLERALERP